MFCLFALFVSLVLVFGFTGGFCRLWPSNISGAEIDNVRGLNTSEEEKCLNILFYILKQ